MHSQHLLCLSQLEYVQGQFILFVHGMIMSARDRIRTCESTKLRGPKPRPFDHFGTRAIFGQKSNYVVLQII